MFLIVLTAITGCAKVPDLAGIGGTFNVIGPDRDLTVALRSGDVPRYWHIDGKYSPGALLVSEAQHLPGLNVKSGPSEYWFVRELHASLLATPFLSWSWFSRPPSAGHHPVKLAVGFADVGTPRTAPWWSVLSSNFPRADRVISIEWAETALGRGTVIGPKRQTDKRSYARYIARGGPEQAEQWWDDSVDLSLLHRQLWPNHAVKNTEIRFIGIWSDGTSEPAGMHLANVRLFR